MTTPSLPPYPPPSRYHYHMDLVCDYTLTAAGHSTLVGVMLDGRGMYGRYETTGAVPMDLDMCGGHVGEHPAAYDYTNQCVMHVSLHEDLMDLMDLMDL